MRALLRVLISAALFLTSFPGAVSSFERSEVAIETASGARRLQVELAVTPEQRQRGLMGRATLAENAGMLFVFEDDRVANMWMHDTRISLDLLFLAGTGRVVKIAPRTAPLSDDVISSGQPVRGVLELPGGSAARLGVRPGDRIVHPRFRYP